MCVRVYIYIYIYIYMYLFLSFLNTLTGDPSHTGMGWGRCVCEVALAASFCITGSPSILLDTWTILNYIPNPD